MNLKIGDSVIVKQAINDLYREEYEIGGWMGRIEKLDNETNKDHTLITVEWDSVTLEQLPSKFIKQAMISGLDWQRIKLYASNLDKTEPRDDKEKVKKIQEELWYTYYWYSFGEEGVRIARVLGSVDRCNEIKCLEKWDKHLDEHVSFPVQAIIDKYADDWGIKRGDVLEIESLSERVDEDGILAEVKHGDAMYEIPLSELEVLDKKSINYQLINDYETWFSDR